MIGTLWTKKEEDLLRKLSVAGHAPIEVARLFKNAGSTRSTDSILRRINLIGLSGVYRNNKKDNIDDINVKISNAVPKMNKTLQKIAETYSEKELKLLAKGGRVIPGQDKIPLIDFSGERYRFCFFTDPHIGSVYFQESMYDAMLVEAERRKVNAFFCAGDVTDGTTNKIKSQMYEQTHHGFKQQRDYAVSLLRRIEKPLYMIDGNHDRWHYGNTGAAIVEDICAKLPNAEFIGSDVGTVVVNTCSIMLWHGEDGSSYATDYRIRKVIEGLTGGSKPNVLLCGHVHKQAYFFARHIHAISGGALCLQSNHMRSKRLENHAGFWIVDMFFNGQGIYKLSPTWYPFYA